MENNITTSTLIVNDHIYTEKKISGCNNTVVILLEFPDIRMTNLSPEAFAACVKGALELACEKYAALVTPEVAAYKGGIEKVDRFDTDIFFTINPGPHTSTPGICHGLRGNTSIKQLTQVYCLLMEKNEWFRKGTGLRFKYNTCSKEGSHSCSSFGEIEILMNEEDKAAEIAAIKTLNEDIRKFYADSTYCGD